MTPRTKRNKANLELLNLKGLEKPYEPGTISERKHSLKHTKNLKEGPWKMQTGAIGHYYFCPSGVLSLWRHRQEEMQTRRSKSSDPPFCFTVSHCYLWPPHAKSWLIGKDSDAGRDWGQEEKGMTEDEMGGWHHRLDGHESEWTPGDGDGQGGLVCCDSWGRKESDTTERLNWTELLSPIGRMWQGTKQVKEEYTQQNKV